MKNLWFDRFKGIVLLYVKGEKAVDFLNAAVQKQIKVWSIRKVDEECIGFFILISDISQLRNLRRDYHVQFSFGKREGLWFHWQRVKKNGSFVLGGFLFVLLVTLLSNTVWEIKITGASKEIEYRIMKQLDEMGVKRGALQFGLHTPQEIQKEITKQNANITWVGVERKGTVYHLQVVEKTIPKVSQPPENRHLVAKKAGVVSYILADKGEPKVKVNQYVKKGQVLISGYIGKEDEPVPIAATGKVLAETWYETTIILPLENRLDTLTGHSKSKYGFSVFGQSFYFPWLENPNFTSFYTEERRNPIYFFKWKLPITWNEKICYETERVETHYTRQEIQKLGVKLAHEKMRQEISGASSVYGIKVLRQRETNGKVEITYHFQMIESIGVYEPIHENKENALNDQKSKDN